MSSDAKPGNPAVVGLAGFGLTTFLLQIHNLGLCGVGPILALAIAFGGGAQLIAGYLEMKVGNNFGFSAFVSYGAFWISFGIILLLNHFDIYSSSPTDIGWFLIAWTLYTAILWVIALRIHLAMATTFTLLLAGFILLDFGHFGFPLLNTVAAYVLIPCALGAWYMMAAIIMNDVAGKTVIPMGKPLITGHDSRPRSEPVEQVRPDLV